MFLHFRNLVTLLTLLSLVRGVFPRCKRSPDNKGRVEWPRTALKIPNRGFKSCPSLTEIKIPASVHEIGDKAFQDAKALKSVEFEAGSSLKIIGNEAFKSCKRLTSIKIPASVEEIGDNAFKSAAGLKSVEFEAGSLVKTIGNRAFKDCTSLTAINIPASVSKIGEEAFDNGTLQKLTFQSSSTLSQEPSQVPPDKPSQKLSFRSSSALSQSNYFADNQYGTQNDAWRSPSGEYFNGVTYVSYQGPHEGSYVASYNHTSKEWKGPYKVFDNLMGLYPEPKQKRADNHGSPTLVISEDGYINVIMGAHGGCAGKGGRPNLYGYQTCVKRPNGKTGIISHARSASPENIDAWEHPLSNLSVFGSYGSTIKMDNGDIYYFYRHGRHRASWVYQKSTDGGAYFADPVVVLKYEEGEVKPRTTIVYVSWYIKCFIDDTHTKNRTFRKIGCAFNHHRHESGPNAYHGSIRYNVYYIEIDTIKGTFHNIKGDTLDAPITLEDANNNNVLAFDSGNRYVSMRDGFFDKYGNPHLIFYFHKLDSRRKTVIQELYYMTYNQDDEVWMPMLAETASKKGNRALFYNDGTTRIAKVRDLSLGYLSRQNGTGAWEWNDNNLPFLNVTVKAKPLYITNIRNAHEDARFLVFRPRGKGPLKDFYKKLYLWGDNGFVIRRNETEANDLWQPCYSARKADECFSSNKRVICDSAIHNRCKGNTCDLCAALPCKDTQKKFWVKVNRKGKQKTCEWVRMNSKCAKYGAKFCPVTCGKCSETSRIN